MDKKILSVSHGMKGVLDDDYTLYEDGTVLHEYDANIYPGGTNLKENLTVDKLNNTVKQRLYQAASDENKQQVIMILKLEI